MWGSSTIHVCCAKKHNMNKSGKRDGKRGCIAQTLQKDYKNTQPNLHLLSLSISFAHRHHLSIPRLSLPAPHHLLIHHRHHNLRSPVKMPAACIKKKKPWSICNTCMDTQMLLTSLLFFFYCSRVWIKCLISNCVGKKWQNDIFHNQLLNLLGGELQ